MKKNRIWIAMGVAAIIGILLCVVGLLLGGRTSIQLWEGTIGMHGEIDPPSLEEDTSIVEQVVDMEDIHKIKILTGAADLKIQTTSKDHVYIEGSGHKNSIRQDGEELEVMVGSQIGDTTQKATLYIPEAMKLQQLELEIGAGAVVLDGVNVVEYDIMVGAGELLARNLTGDKIDIECGIGSVMVEGGFQKSIEVECGMGEVEIKSSEDLALYTQEVSTTIGKVQIGDREISGIGNNNIENTGVSRKIEVECGIGTVSIQNQ